jgi:HK97 gp10 family phage protein
MAKKDVIWVDGERELFLNMQRTMDGTLKAAMQGIEKAALSIIADAKDNLKGNHSVVTGQLRASGRVQRVEGDEQALDAGFFSQDTTGGYASFVEYGRRAGKMPPVYMLKQWVRKKFGVDAKEAKAIGFLIARKIAKKGTKPHPFFAPAVEKNKGEVEAAIKTAYEQAIK